MAQVNWALECINSSDLPQTTIPSWRNFQCSPFVMHFSTKQPSIFFFSLCLTHHDTIGNSTPKKTSCYSVMRRLSLFDLCKQKQWKIISFSVLFFMFLVIYRRTNVKYTGNNRQKSLIINKKRRFVRMYNAITNTSAEKRKRDKAELRRKCDCSNNFSTSPAASSVCHFAGVRQLLLHSFRFINWTVSLISCENLFNLIKGRQPSSGNSMGKV